MKNWGIKNLQLWQLVWHLAFPSMLSVPVVKLCETRGEIYCSKGKGNSGQPWTSHELSNGQQEFDYLKKKKKLKLGFTDLTNESNRLLLYLSSHPI